MAKVTAAPFVLKDAVLTIGTDDYEAHVASVRFDPATNVVTFQSLTPAGAFTDTTSPTWTATLTYAQDWKTANSLAQYLLANAGQKKTCVFKPQGITTGSPIFTVDLMIAPGPIGGDVNTVQTAQVTLGCVGAPVKTAAP